MKGNTNRGVAQLASASGLGPEGPVFESQYPDKKQLSTDSCFFYITLGQEGTLLHQNNYFCGETLLQWILLHEMGISVDRQGLNAEFP